MTTIRGWVLIIALSLLDNSSSKIRGGDLNYYSKIRDAVSSASLFTLFPSYLINNKYINRMYMVDTR